MRALLGLALIAFVAGCATVGVERVEQLKPGTRVAVLSVMGDRLAVRHVGTTVFQNERRDVDVPQWQIDRSTENAAARLIGTGGRFKVVTADTTDARRRAGKMATGFFSGPQLQGGPQSVAAFAKQAGADYVLVIAPNPIGDPFMGTNQSFAGYGIYQRGFMGTRNAGNFLTLRVVLHDGRSGDEVARTQDHASSRRADALWMDSSKLVLSESNAAATKTAIEELIERSLKKTLAQLKLAP